MRITPEHIQSLATNQVFVYGANLSGRHGAGAARQALQWGAAFGVVGFNGNTYGIVTKDRKIKTMPLHQIKARVEWFTEFAARHTNKIFLVTKIGCGLAGYTPDDIAPMFREASKLENVWLPKEFWGVLERTTD